MPSLNAQYININELNTIQGVVKYLNQYGDADLDFNVTVEDSNGNHVGTIRRLEGEYHLCYMVEDLA